LPDSGPLLYPHHYLWIITASTLDTDRLCGVVILGAF
jgi:hypothetical protein